MSERKIIEENWDVIDAFELKIKELEETDECSFNLDIFYLDGVRRLGIPMRYRKKKSNGKYTKKTYYTTCYAEYCPFSGKPLYHNSVGKEKITPKS